jgi:hypothetical protein
VGIDGERAVFVPIHACIGIAAIGDLLDGTLGVSHGRALRSCAGGVRPRHRWSGITQLLRAERRNFGGFDAPPRVDLCGYGRKPTNSDSQRENAGDDYPHSWREDVMAHDVPSVSADQSVPLRRGMSLLAVTQENEGEPRPETGDKMITSG